MTNKRTPVIIGIAQYTQFWQDDQLPLHPLQMLTKVSRIALEDTHQATILCELIDSVYVVNMLSHSYADAPAALAESLNITPKHKYYSDIGGANPQYLVNKACLALEKGEAKAVLIAGAEVVYGTKKALQKGIKLDFPPHIKPNYISEPSADGLASWQAQYDLFLPTHTYPLFETSYRQAKGHSIAEHQAYIGQIYEKLAKKAANNQYAWSKTAFTAKEIIESTPENRYIAYPYTKRMVANIQVDMASCVILTTWEEAEKLHIPYGKAVFVQGATHLTEVWDFLERPILHQVPALQKCIQLALQQARLFPEDLTALDLYSCFPIAVEVALDALHLSPQSSIPFTLTGGLSFFGGAGNNYALHAIVEAVNEVRQHPNAKILVTALSWYMSKFAVGIYSLIPPVTPHREMQEILLKETQNKLNSNKLPAPIVNYEGNGSIAGYSILYDQNQQPSKVIIACDLPAGNRTLAFLDMPKNDIALILEQELVKRQVKILHDTTTKRNWATLLA